MKEQALTTIETESVAPSRPASEDSGAHASHPGTRGRAALRWFIETLALAGCGMAGVYVGVWLDPDVQGAADWPPPEDREKQRHH